MSVQDFEGRVVIVTGGAGGVGREVSLRWLQAGASVMVVDHGEPALHDLRAAWEASSGSNSSRLATLASDVTTAEGVAQMVAAAERAWGEPADTLVHLVGGFAMGPLDAPEAPGIWEKMMALNLHSAFHCYRAMLPALRARAGGWIVGIGSRAAVTPSAGLAAYAASKAGLAALTQALSAEVGGEGIHVNLILASTIDTPANRRSLSEKTAGDWVRPGDIADATLYLCSHRARAVYGATLEVYANA